MTTPEDATHRDSGGNLYKAGEELNWLRWGNDEWFIYGTVPAGTLRPIKGAPNVQTAAPVMPTAAAPIPAPFRPSEAPMWECPKAPEPFDVGFAYYFTPYRFVGSRVTCNPPPLNTDQDVLALVHPANHAVMERKILEAGFVKEGSLPADIAIDAAAGNVFHSYRKGDMNYIVTTDEAFYQRFSTATELARKYNLMEKSDRIQLFQAVLYGKWWA